MDIASMEPLVPGETARALEDEMVSLIAESNQLAGRIHPILLDSIGDLVRSTNCYYSNLIEGHNTHPRDIDRALAADYSTNSHRRDLQLEARAHIEVERMISPRSWAASRKPMIRVDSPSRDRSLQSRPPIIAY